MKANSAVRAAMKARGIGPTRLAERLGKPCRFVTDRMSRENIGIENVAELLRVMDYKIVVVPSDTKMQDDWFEID